MSKKLTAAEAEEYTKNIGSVAVGNFGLMEFARDTLKVPEALGITFDQWVTERLGGFVRRSVEQRREAVAELSGEKGENGRYARSAKDVAEILGIGEQTVEEDRKVIETAKGTATMLLEAGTASKATATMEKPSKMTPEERKAAIRSLIDKGKSDAEIVLELSVGVSTVAKERRAYKQEQNAPDTSGLQKRRKTVAKEVMSPEEADARISEVADRMRKALGDSTYSEFLSLELEEILDLTKRLVASGTEITDFERVLHYWGQIGNELWVYGAKRGLDVSSIADAIDHMKGGDSS